MSDDEIPQLSAESLAALNAFRLEQQVKEEKKEIDEDWQLSQFWYDAETSRKLVKESITVALKFFEKSDGNDVPRIGCVSSPTLVQYFHETEEYKNGQISLKLFEYDTRFGLKYPEEFVEFDYKQPTVLPEELLGKFDFIIADPPFLAAECLIKTAHSLRLLAKKEARILLCTGAIMEEYPIYGKNTVIVARPSMKTALDRIFGRTPVKFVRVSQRRAARLLAMHRTHFEPGHANNLANNFACFANYPTITL